MSTPWQDEVTGRSDYADRHSGQRDNSRNVAFTGVDTGAKYVVGQYYVMNGDRYRANVDGSFQNMRTGNMLDGSSGASGATFYVKADAASSRGGEGAASAHVLTTTGATSGAASSGPGNGAVAAATVVSTTGPGSPAVSAGGGGWGPGSFGALTAKPPKVKAKDGEKVQRVGDNEVILHPNFPDVEDFWEPRYGEPGEWLGGISNIAADAVANLPRYVGDHIKVVPGGVTDRVSRFGDNAIKTWDGAAQAGAFAKPFEDARRRDELSGPGMLTTPNYGY